MNFRMIVWVACVSIMACDRTSEVEPEVEQPPLSHEHHEQAEHEPVPRIIALSAQVVADAGIESEVASPRSIRPTVRVPGEIVADPDRRARVGARLSGIIESVHVQVGDRVAAGDRLAVIRTPDLQGLRAAEASLRAQTESARANAERLRLLADKGMASVQEATAAEAQANALLAETKAAKERLRAIGGRTAAAKGPIFYEVRAPRAGLVTERRVVVGDPVEPTDVLATVVALDEVWFSAHVFERSVPQVQPGHAATVVLNAYPEQPWSGTVTQISYEVEPGTHTLSARIPLRNEHERLRLGLFGTAFVEVGGTPSKPRLAVPRSAVTDVLGVPTVFVQHADGDFERHDVTLGRADTSYVEVVEGLREGERIAIAGVVSIKSALLRETFGEEE